MSEKKEEVSAKMKILGQFIKDLSFENIAAQESKQGTGTPNIEVKINLDASKRTQDDQYNCSIKINVESKDAETNENIFLRIFPNPVQSILIIEYSKPIKRVLIYNLLGQKILEYLPNNSSVEINLINLKTGIYLLKINDLRLKKIIKK